MAEVVAVTEQSPEQVFAYLKACGDAERITYLPPGGVLNPEGKYRQHIFIVGSDLYSRNACAIRDLPDEHTVYVFGHRRILEKFGLTSERMLHELEPERAKLIAVGNYTRDLIKAAIASSLFNSLMTYIYTLPSKTHQKPVTSAICKWIYSGSNKTAKALLSDKKLSLSNKHIQALTDILASPVTDRLRQSFEDLRTGECETIGQTVVKNQVQMFEFSYIRGNVLKAANITDTYVANQGTSE